MKTTLLITLGILLICCHAGYSINESTLPENEVSVKPLDKLSIIKPTFPVIPEKIILNESSSEKDKDSDTIIIELSEVVITSPFPANSRKCILEQVPYPAFAQEGKLEGGVIVRFVFDQEGIIHVLEANSTDSRLENYVRNRLSELQLRNCMVEIGKDYYIRFLFKLY